MADAEPTGPASAAPGATTAPLDADAVTVRRVEADDANGIGDVWLASWRATFDFDPGYPDEVCRQWLATEVVPLNETWVAVDGQGTVIALMALSDDMIDQLYVAPAWTGRGVGRRLVAVAKDRRPAGLDLYCFAVNANARRFYERQGFTAVAFGDGSRNSEHQPDIRYAWRRDS